MRVTATTLPEVLLIEPDVYTDSRGFFMESFNQRNFVHETGVDTQFVQDNHSRSAKNVLRGLHYQLGRAQGKLVRVTSGVIFDVAVDIRASSPRFRQWVAVELSAKNNKQLWIPPGFAHGFLVLGESADVLYKTTDYYAAKQERCIRWDDPELCIGWPALSVPILSSKDSRGELLCQAELPR